MRYIGILHQLHTSILFSNQYPKVVLFSVDGNGYSCNAEFNSPLFRLSTSLNQLPIIFVLHLHPTIFGSDNLAPMLLQKPLKTLKLAPSSNHWLKYILVSSTIRVVQPSHTKLLTKQIFGSFIVEYFGLYTNSLSLRDSAIDPTNRLKL